MDKRRWFILIATSLMAAATLLWLQGRYEKGDMRNALELVQTYHSRAGVSIPDLLSYRHPQKGIQWSTAVENSCFQHIRVHAVVSGDPGQEPTVYAFAVDINGPSIHPANDNGQLLLGLMDEPLPVASTSASSEPTAVLTASASSEPTAVPVVPAASASSEPTPLPAASAPASASSEASP